MDALKFLISEEENDKTDFEEKISLNFSSFGALKSVKHELEIAKRSLEDNSFLDTNDDADYIFPDFYQEQITVKKQISAFSHYRKKVAACRCENYYNPTGNDLLRCAEKTHQKLCEEMEGLYTMYNQALIIEKATLLDELKSNYAAVFDTYKQIEKEDDERGDYSDRQGHFSSLVRYFEKYINELSEDLEKQCDI